MSHVPFLFQAVKTHDSFDLQLLRVPAAEADSPAEAFSCSCVLIRVILSKRAEKAAIKIKKRGCASINPKSCQLRAAR